VAAGCYAAGLVVAGALSAGGLIQAASAHPAVPAPAAAACVLLSGGATACLLALGVFVRPAALVVSAVPLLALQGVLTGLAETWQQPDASGLHLKRVVVIGTVAGPPGERAGRVRVGVRPDRILADSIWSPHRDPILVTIMYGSRDSVRPALRYGSRVALAGSLLLPSPPRNPGEVDMRAWYRANGYSHDMLVRGAAGVVLLGEGDVPWFARWIVEPVRLAAVEALDAGYDGQAGEFLKGLLLGIRDGIDRETQEAFVNAGVAHILAVSGSNVALVAGVVLFLLGLVRLPVRYTAVPVALSLVLYMFITGSQPPVVRATLMALLVVGAQLVQRRACGLNVIGASALLALIEAPRLIGDAGFQLSFSAVVALVLAYPSLDRRILALRVPRPLRPPLLWVLRPAGISLVATLGTLPFTALSFGRLSVIGILANVPVVPLSGVAVVLGAASMICRWLLPPLAPAFETVNTALLDLTLLIARAAGGVPWACIDTSAWSVAHVLPPVALAGAWMGGRGSRTRRLLVLGAVASAAAAICVPLRATFDARLRTLTVSAIDVGQGDAILLQFPDGVSMLVDAGPRTPSFDAGRRTVAPLLHRLGSGRLRYLAVTHPHSDHIGGLGGVLRSMHVDTVLSAEPIDLAGEDVRLRVVSAGTLLAPTPDARVYVLWPHRGLPGDGAAGRDTSLAGANDRSLVMKVVFGDFSILLTGDAEAGVEARLAGRYREFLRSPILKVGHHGSSTSSSSPFLRAVGPELAVMSVGTLNRFGHPSDVVIARFAAIGCGVRRTDLDGCIMIRSDGRTWEPVVWRE
jgi:competence protein ComEC